MLMHVTYYTAPGHILLYFYTLLQFQGKECDCEPLSEIADVYCPGSLASGWAFLRPSDCLKFYCIGLVRVISYFSILIFVLAKASGI